MPLVKGASEPVPALSSQGSRSTSNFLLTMAWKAAMSSRACTRAAPRSIAATTPSRVLKAHCGRWSSGGRWFGLKERDLWRRIRPCHLELHQPAAKPISRKISASSALGGLINDNQQTTFQLNRRQKRSRFAGHFSRSNVVRHGFETPDCACSGGQG
jgi:hypothetical protein